MDTFHAREYTGTGIETLTPKTASAVLPSRVNQKSTEVRPWTCLLLSFDKSRLKALSQSASNAGWKALEASSVGEAIRHHKLWLTQLAVIDLGDMPDKQKETFRKFGSKYVAGTQSLMMVCESEGCVTSELWARKLAAWLYLPEVDLAEDLENLYSEAIKVAEKMNLQRATC